jgi:hypothetical protein
MTILADLHALDSLDMWLRARGYSRNRIQRIRNSIWLHGELVSAIESGDLAPHHEHEASEVYALSLPAAFADDPSWGADDARYVTLDPIVGTDSVGGDVHLSDCEPPFEPSEADWAEYRRWAQSLGAGRPDPVGVA